MRRITPDDDVAVIGAGTMGAGIAEVAARAGHRVRLFDTRPRAGEQALQGCAGASSGTSPAAASTPGRRSTSAGG